MEAVSEIFIWSQWKHDRLDKAQQGAFDDAVAEHLTKKFNKINMNDVNFADKTNMIGLSAIHWQAACKQSYPKTGAGNVNQVLKRFKKLIEYNQEQLDNVEKKLALRQIK